MGCFGGCLKSSNNQNAPNVGVISLKRENTMRPHQELSDKFKKIKNEIVEKFIKNPRNAEEYNNDIQTMLYNITNYLVNHNGKPEDIKNQTDNKSQLWLPNVSQLKSRYGALHEAYMKLIDEEKIISRIETHAHIRALLFRFLTTIAIGAGIMLTYYFAHKWGIPMPLSRSITSGL